ncbi:hypothetical protein F5887DRAFT_1231708 [Amanita rubescens]|nr:hypothetical protein F5887DRAFT_1231708 [Amanita rubescens]
MSEDVQKKTSNAIATQAAGLGGQYAWKNAANLNAPIPPKPKPAQSATSSSTMAAATSTTTTTTTTTTTANSITTTTTTSSATLNSSWATPYIPTKPKAAPPPQEEDTRLAITIWDARVEEPPENANVGAIHPGGERTQASDQIIRFRTSAGTSRPSYRPFDGNTHSFVYAAVFGGRHIQKFYWGTKETILPVYTSVKDAAAKHPDVDVVVNFASNRSIHSSTLECMTLLQIKAIALISGGVPERHAPELLWMAHAKGVLIIGPATVHGIKPGCFRIGNSGRYRPGSVGYVSKSGGMSNELNNILSLVTDGTYEGIAIGGDRYPGTTFIDHLLCYEQDPDCKMHVLLGEVGGIEKYRVIEAVKKRIIKKPIIAWAIGTCAKMFTTEVQFGHTGSMANSDMETADAKNRAMKEAGFIVPDTFEELPQVLKETYQRLVRNGTIGPEEGEGASYHSHGLQMGTGLPTWATKFIEMVLMTADHGPAVSGAMNTIMATRTGKDLISSLASAVSNGALDEAVAMFSNARDTGMTPRESVDSEGPSYNYTSFGLRMRSFATNFRFSDNQCSTVAARPAIRIFEHRTFPFMDLPPEIHYRIIAEFVKDLRTNFDDIKALRLVCKRFNAIVKPKVYSSHIKAFQFQNFFDENVLSNVRQLLTLLSSQPNEQLNLATTLFIGKWDWLCGTRNFIAFREVHPIDYIFINAALASLYVLLSIMSPRLVMFCAPLRTFAKLRLRVPCTLKFNLPNVSCVVWDVWLRDPKWIMSRTIKLLQQLPQAQRTFPYHG